MELENIKTMWAQLDQQLKSQEKIKKSVLETLIKNNGDRALNKLNAYEGFGLIIVTLSSPIIPYFLYTQYESFTIYSLILLYVLAVFVFASIGVQVWKLVILSKISYSQTISLNIKSINKYNLYIKKEKQFIFILLPLLVLFYVARVYFEVI